MGSSPSAPLRCGSDHTRSRCPDGRQGSALPGRAVQCSTRAPSNRGASGRGAFRRNPAHAALGAAPEVVLDRRYPFGEYRYLSYCSRVCLVHHRPLASRGRPGRHRVVLRRGQNGSDRCRLSRSRSTATIFGGRAVTHLWTAFGDAMLAHNPSAQWYRGEAGRADSTDHRCRYPSSSHRLRARSPGRARLSSERSRPETGFDGFGRRPGEASRTTCLASWPTSPGSSMTWRQLLGRWRENGRLRYEDFGERCAGYCEPTRRMARESRSIQAVDRSNTS